VARVVALIPDLLFGSRVQEMLASAGHEVTLCPDEASARAKARGSDVFVVDLAGGSLDGVALLAAMRAAGELAGTRTLAFYAHVDADTRRRAEGAGYDLVVPRSRLAREGAELVSALASG
jgi:CheY-like chemotaxis protein